MVQEFGMIRSTTDHSVFYHHTSTGQCIYLIVYVDDIIIIGSDQDGFQKLKQHLFSHFQTKDLGKLKYFLGIEVAQSNSGAVISQKKYTLDIWVFVCLAPQSHGTQRGRCVWMRGCLSHPILNRGEIC